MIITVSILATVFNISAVLPRVVNIKSFFKNSNVSELLREKPKKQKLRGYKIYRTFRNSV